MAEYQGVLVYGEVLDGKIAPITKELLGVGGKLASDLGEPLWAVLLGSGIADAAKESIAYGAEKVYLVDDPLLADPHSDSYTAVVTKVHQEVNPKILLIGQTDIGRDIAPRLAARLGAGLTMDCVDLKIDPASKSMIQTRPAYGGNAMAVVKAASPQIATARAKSMTPSEPDDSRQGEVVMVQSGIDSSVIRAVKAKVVKEETEGVKLEDAEVVVAGGRGIGSAEGFDTLYELAKVFGGAVGATRAAYEEGWVPSALQIGQTGKVVGPKLYVAIALSGAMQHLAGCAGSKNIVAINKDPDANIFNVARFGIVGDYKTAIPALTEKCRELLMS